MEKDQLSKFEGQTFRFQPAQQGSPKAERPNKLSGVVVFKERVCQPQKRKEIYRMANESGLLSARSDNVQVGKY